MIRSPSSFRQPPQESLHRRMTPHHSIFFKKKNTTCGLFIYLSIIRGGRKGKKKEEKKQYKKEKEKDMQEFTEREKN